jgi:hypothetical protein
LGENRVSSKLAFFLQRVREAVTSKEAFIGDLMEMEVM